MTRISGEHVFALKFLQARDPEWVNRLFFAYYDPHATWLSDLKPAFGESEFFFESAMRDMQEGAWTPEWATSDELAEIVLPDDIPEFVAQAAT